MICIRTNDHHPNDIELFVKDVFVEIYRFGTCPLLDNDVESLVSILTNFKPIEIDVMENIILDNYFNDYISWLEDFLNISINSKEIKNKLGSYSRITQEEINLSCVICQSNFKKNEGFRKLNCNHMFHKKCIDKWFIKSQKWNCPMCRCDSSLKSI